ncbi:MAG TPA: transglutaminase family protein [Bryobacteraceae bacterium]|nr:transglutaminase family protein [Bryobacteraceae bacterium]
MRFQVTHSTIYRYEGPVYLEPQTLRLRPREDGTQRLRRYALEISPAPGGRSECLDQDGNAVVEAWFDRPVEELKLTSSFDVETLRENPFDFVLADSRADALPFAYSGPVGAELAPCLESAPETGVVRDLARTVVDAAGGQTLAFLTTLNRTLYENFAHVVRENGPPHPPDLTARSKEGSCRDLALLFCAASRSMGIAARFVSGYEMGASMTEQADMHAWAEVYLPGGGWRGYDPSQGLAVAGTHVAVAASADPRLAAPLSGRYRGSARSKMEFAISMQVAGDAPPGLHFEAAQ